MQDQWLKVESVPLLEGNLGSLIRTIFWLVLIGYAIRWIARLSVIYAVNKTQEELNQRVNRTSDHATQKRNARSFREPEAEDVDYIEIKDE